MINSNDVNKWLQEVEHPAKGDKNLVELGMVENIEIAEGQVTVTLAFAKHRDPLAEYLIGSAKAAIIRNAPQGTQVEIKSIIKNEAAPKKKGLDLGEEELANVKHIIGIASGKGGVGKSTVSVNLAVALARLGYKVGLADADVYGPSVPKMTATEGLMPDAFQEGEKEIIVPLEKYGVKWMSIGYFARPEQALIWRGPMACNALKQMILQVRWGELDFLLIDMPPGTGDVPLTVFQSLPVNGIVVVTSPQELVSMIVGKAVKMANLMNVPVLSLVENMSYFECPDCKKKISIFGESKIDSVASDFLIDTIAKLPICPEFANLSDKGQIEKFDGDYLNSVVEKILKI